MFDNNGLPFSRHSDVLNAVPVGESNIKSLLIELKRRGNAAFQQRSFGEAQALYTKAIDSDPQNCSNTIHIFYANRAAVNNGMGKFEEGLRDADKCIEIESTYVKGHFRKAQALQQLKRFHAALKTLKEARNLNANDKAIANLYEEIEKQAANSKNVTTQTPRARKVVTCERTCQNQVPVKERKSMTGNVSAPVMDEADEKVATDMRGYRKLADGRVTTYFNNELDETAKRLIGDIAPKKVDSTEHIQIKSVEGGSAWNQGNTFEEKDMTSWGRLKLKQLLENLSVPFAENGILGTLKITSVADLHGDASIAVVRGKKRYIFDFMFHLECELEIADQTEKVKGDIKFLDFSSDCDSDYDIEVMVPLRHTTQSGKAMYASLMSNTSALRVQVATKLKQFKSEYHTF